MKKKLAVYIMDISKHRKSVEDLRYTRLLLFLNFLNGDGGPGTVGYISLTMIFSICISLWFFMFVLNGIEYSVAFGFIAGVFVGMILECLIHKTITSKIHLNHLQKIWNRHVKHLSVEEKTLIQKHIDLHSKSIKSQNDKKVIVSLIKKKIIMCSNTEDTPTPAYTIQTWAWEYFRLASYVLNLNEE